MAFGAIRASAIACIAFLITTSRAQQLSSTTIDPSATSVDEPFNFGPSETLTATTGADDPFVFGTSTQTWTAVDTFAVSTITGSPSFSWVPISNPSSYSGYQNPGLVDLTSTRMAVLYAHGVMACMVFAVFIPMGGILLRLKKDSPNVLRIHVRLQIFSLVAFLAAMGLGVTLACDSMFGGGLWDDAHPILGMVILFLFLLQPLLGAVHHRIYKRRVALAQDEKSTPVTSSTIPGFMHLWLGRILIVLGIINGGLGIRYASALPFQDSRTTQTFAIVFSAVAAVSITVYIGVNVMAELNERRSKSTSTVAVLETNEISHHIIPQRTEVPEPNEPPPSYTPPANNSVKVIVSVSGKKM